MQSYANVVSSFFNGLFFEFLKRVEEEPVEKDEYKYYTFNCWLCKGESKFKCKPNVGKNHYDLDCSRCGIENKVKVVVKSV